MNHLGEGLLEERKKRKRLYKRETRRRRSEPKSDTLKWQVNRCRIRFSLPFPSPLEILLHGNSVLFEPQILKERERRDSDEGTRLHKVIYQSTVWIPGSCLLFSLPLSSSPLLLDPRL